MTANSAKERHWIGKERENRYGVMAGEWSGAAPFQSILSMVHDAPANTAIHPCTVEPSWSSHCLPKKVFSGRLH